MFSSDMPTKILHESQEMDTCLFVHGIHNSRPMKSYFYLSEALFLLLLKGSIITESKCGEEVFN